MGNTLSIGRKCTNGAKLLGWLGIQFWLNCYFQILRVDIIRIESRERERGFKWAAFFICASPMKGVFRTSKQRGEWVELKFMAGAAELGLNLAKPWGDST